MLLFQPTSLPSSAFRNFCHLFIGRYYIIVPSDSTPFHSDSCPHIKAVSFPSSLSLSPGGLQISLEVDFSVQRPNPSSRTTRMESNLSFSLPEGKYPVLLKKQPRRDWDGAPWSPGPGKLLLSCVHSRISLHLYQNSSCFLRFTSIPGFMCLGPQGIRS